jgi:hypothetical protein
MTITFQFNPRHAKQLHRACDHCGPDQSVSHPTSSTRATSLSENEESETSLQMPIRFELPENAS